MNALSWVSDMLNGDWDLQSDRLRVYRGSEDQMVWEGPLLPSLWLAPSGGERLFVKAEVSGFKPGDNATSGELELVFPDVANGQMRFTILEDSLRIESFSLHWLGQPIPIIAMYIGAVEMGEEERRIVPSLDVPFWPAWLAEGVCIPGGKTGPIQSFFRNWELGHSRIALGNFAPAMGSLYGAAYPRPLLACGMGGKHGWVVLGTPSAPDGALTFQTRSSCACLEILYREDLWGSVDQPTRTWEDFLHVTWGDHPVEVYGRFYYPEQAETKPSGHQLSWWNTWGDFKERVFELDDTAERSKNSFDVDVLVYDDLWETMNSSGDPNYERFPEFDQSVQKALDLGLKIGFWQSVGWLDDPEVFDLDKNDLLCGADGEPRQCSWSFDPFSKAPRHYALDPSSPRARQFLIERTKRVIERYPTSLLKLDFCYGLPGPDVAVPRDLEWRGERMGIGLFDIIAKTALEVRPDIIIVCYSLSPLFAKYGNIVSLDDLGDAAGREAEGHGQWSAWATIAGRGGLAINASSGYHWEAERDVLLNTAVIGAPGGILPTYMADGSEMPKEQFRPRRALAKWFRRTAGWKPLWLNSHLGDFNRDPEINCWGRLEVLDGEERLVSLALRSEAHESGLIDRFPNLGWEGDWAIISQDDQAIEKSSAVAFIPIGLGKLSIDYSVWPKKVVGVFESESGDREEDIPWEWVDGVLLLSVDDFALFRGLLGIVVYRADNPGDSN
ncbi:hypothetical protein [Rubellicoccus peritrichatus]|uniref:Alpha-galactosidase n=1 Tax=Rubellicoccus peritrichatus TaxID=3080537 RepID=A0AAQ3QU29_9BACT|nr:hypothetical protein [Puniceicoccus sp. CR14]WOO41986.1 hypothetical protein RZN69_02720 [Puniceicoccus sp. CR14]